LDTLLSHPYPSIYLSSLLLRPPFFFFYSYVDHRDLHSFPTRRSSDLFGCHADALILHLQQDMVRSVAQHGERDLTPGGRILDGRSEEHTSELQSRGHLVCRLLLEKKK